LGTATDRPYSPTASPRRSGGTIRPASTEPSTVRIAKPTPRRALIHSSQGSPSSTAYSGAGSPSTSRPATSTLVAPNRAVSAGTTACTAMVTTRKAAVTDPATTSLVPPPTA
jgi:hypothetical protein